MELFPDRPLLAYKANLNKYRKFEITTLILSMDWQVIKAMDLNHLSTTKEKKICKSKHHTTKPKPGEGRNKEGEKFNS